MNVNGSDKEEKVLFTPLAQNLYDRYIQVGTQAYNEHYLHLWKDEDSTPYLKKSFTIEVLDNEEKDSNTEHYIVYYGVEACGIIKLIRDSPMEPHSSQAAMLLDKIYLLRAYSGKGIGTKALDFVTTRARLFKKKIIWLDTMKNGPALKFYQKNGFSIHREVKLQFPTTIEEQRPMYSMYKLL